jgi:hypothetical protein
MSFIYFLSVYLFPSTIRAIIRWLENCMLQRITVFIWPIIFIKDPSWGVRVHIQVVIKYDYFQNINMFNCDYFQNINMFNC